MKIYYRNAVLWNQVLFMMFSFLFLHTSLGIIHERSIFDLASLRYNMYHYRYFIGLMSISIGLMYYLKKISTFLFLLVTSIVVVLNVALLFNSFSKLVVILLFFYVVSAYYNFQFLKEELNEAYYNPNFDDNRLFRPMLYTLNCKLKVKGVEYKGQLSNWNENGCFVYLQEPVKIKGRCFFTVTIDDTEFYNTGHIISSNSKQDGVGIKFFENRLERYNWVSFYQLTQDKGFTSEFLR